MKLIIAIISVFLLKLPTSSHAVNLNSEGIGYGYHYNEYIEPILLGKWRKDFFKFLIENESTKMQAVGIALYHRYYHQEQQQLTEYLDQLLPLDLNKESFYVLRSVCHKLNQYKLTCERHDYYNRLIQKDPLNIDLYIRGLFQYEKSINPQLINYSNEKIKQSTHSSSYNGYFMNDLKTELTNFIKLNPNPLSEPHPLFNKIGINLSPTERNETIVNNLVKMLNQRINKGPYYHYFLGTCNKKSTNDEIKTCNHVISILINKSDSINRKSVGYYWQIKMQITNHDFRVVENLNSNNIIITYSKLKTTSFCQANPGNEAGSKTLYSNYKKLYPIYLNTVIKNTNKFGLDKAKKTGYLVLKDYLLTNKLVKKSSFKDCEKINELTDNEFFDTYNDNASLKAMLNKYNKFKP